ncbi:hypothetical protein Taro_053279 [Colocasia esculenta]|uniref:Uncharacterized protein n=1 Tax=Colocasia esculenta TaxID=4460 RepID=A0A843XMC2_COLES|nr:hypothetical protein [Colocasia esculenta]
MPCACWACRGLQASGSARFLLCLPHLFTRCLALEGLSRSEVVSVAWDPHRREPLRERSGLRACSSWKPTGRTLELREKRGLDSGAESFVELSWLGLGHRGWPEFYPVQASQSLVSLPHSTLVLEPCREVRRGATTWPGCGVARVEWSSAVLSRSSGEVCGFPARFVCMLQVGCSCCYVSCMASVVSRCVHAVVARSALDSLAVVFPVWRTIAGKSRRGSEVCRWFGWCVLAGFPRTVPWWFWWRFSQDLLALLLLAAVFSLMVRVVWSFGLCILVKVLPRIALCRFWQRFFPGVLCVRSPIGGVSLVAAGNCVLCRALLATVWVADLLAPTMGYVGGCSRAVFDWHFLLFGPDLTSLVTYRVVVPFRHPTFAWSLSRSEVVSVCLGPPSSRAFKGAFWATSLLKLGGQAWGHSLARLRCCVCCVFFGGSVSLFRGVPFLGASLWCHRRVWLPDLEVCPGSGVVLLVGPRPCGGLRWSCY